MEDISQGISLYKSTPNAVLIDLRDAEDYSEGHIPGAVNMLPETIREQGRFPCIIHWNFNHFVVLNGFTGRHR